MVTTLLLFNRPSDWTKMQDVPLKTSFISFILGKV